MKTPFWKQINWRDPRHQVALGLLAILPFAAGHYVKMGLFLGLMLCMGILFLLGKLPKKLQKLFKKFGFLADLVLSSLAVASLGGIFGSGLTMAVGALSCAVVLSYSLPRLQV